MLRSSVQPPVDTRTDEYSAYNYSEYDELEVQILEYAGFMALASKTGVVIQLLSQSVLKRSTLLLNLRTPITSMLEKLEELGVNDPTMRDIEAYHDLFATSIGLVDHHEHESSLSEHSKDNLNMEGQRDVVTTDDIMAAMDYNELDEWSEQDSESEYGSEPPDTDPGGDCVDDDDIFSQLDPDDPLIFSGGALHLDSAPVSEQGVRRNDPRLSYSLLVGRVTEMTADEKRKMGVPGHFFTYEVETPMALETNVFIDNSKGYAIDKLFFLISKLSPVDSVWMRSFLVDSLEQYGPLVAAYKERNSRIASEAQDVSGKYGNLASSEWE